MSNFAFDEKTISFFFARTTEQRNGKTETPWHCSRMFKPGSQVFALKRIRVSASNFFTGLTHLVLTFFGPTFHSNPNLLLFGCWDSAPRFFNSLFTCGISLLVPMSTIYYGCRYDDFQGKRKYNEVTSSICWKCPRQTLVNNAGSDRDQTNVYFHICWKPIHAIC